MYLLEATEKHDLRLLSILTSSNIILWLFCLLTGGDKSYDTRGIVFRIFICCIMIELGNFLLRVLPLI